MPSPGRLEDVRRYCRSGSELATMWGPRSIAKLVNVTTISRWFTMVYNHKPVVRWGCKPAFIVITISWLF